jgi:phosphoribosylformylglycinamidine synthase
MVAVVRPQMLDAVLAVCDRWELHHAVIGEVTDTGLLRALWEDEVVGEIPARLLTDECPRYTVEQRPRPEPSDSLLQGLPNAPDPPTALLELLGSPNIRRRESIYRRYDHLVGSRTVRRPGFDAAVLRLRPGYRGLAVSLDGPGPIAWLDPRAGGALAVLEAARNVAVTGGEPVGLTDCLNFGNPEKPEIAWELAESIEGMAEAAEALRVPIVSGNVSLYNETDGRAIQPTPVVGCVGVVPDVRELPDAWQEGDIVLLASASAVALAGSEYQTRYGTVGGRPATLDLAAEASLVEFLWRTAPQCSLVHDVSHGGLAVCLAEAAVASGVGADIELPDDPTVWFGEGGGRAIVACAPELVNRIGGVPLRRLGVVGGTSLLGIELDELREANH